MSTQDVLNTLIFSWGPTVFAWMVLLAMIYGLIRAAKYLATSAVKWELQPGLRFVVVYLLGGLTGYALVDFKLDPRHSVIVISESTRFGEMQHPKITVVISEPGTKLTAVPVDFKQVKARLERFMPFENYDPMMSAGHIYDHKDGINLSDLFSTEEIAAYNALHILPFNPVLKQDCKLTGFSENEHELEPHEIGSEAWKKGLKDNFYWGSMGRQNCNWIFETPKHPYASLPIAELETIALENNDEIAMLFFGRRYRELFDSRIFDKETILTGQAQWLLRAVVLSGKPGPIMWQANFTWDKKDRLSLEFLGRMLADPRADPDKYKALLAEEENGEAEIKLAWAKASDYYAFMERYKASRSATAAVNINPHQGGSSKL